MIPYTAAVLLDFREEAKDVRDPKDGVWYVKYTNYTKKYLKCISTFHSQSDVNI